MPRYKPMTCAVRVTGLLGLLTASALPTFAQEASRLDQLPRLDFRMMSKAAVEKSLPLLQKGAAGFLEKGGRGCASCHHQSLSQMTMAYARQRGFAVDEKLAREQTEFVQGGFKMLQPLSEKAITQPKVAEDLDHILVDPTASVGYFLVGLEMEGIKPDTSTQSAAVYLMRKQAEDGRWPVWAARPPLEGSEFTATALAIRAVQKYAPPQMTAEVAQRTAKARAWLLATPGKSTEDKVFRLFGLNWTNADPKAIKTAAHELLTMQNDDGGWSQLPNLNSDAYATGQVLVALNRAAGIPITEAAMLRGCVHLLLNQKEDGSWLVTKRTAPGQPFFDTGFPHGISQYISYAGTCWATMALTLATPEPSPATKQTASAR